MTDYVRVIPRDLFNEADLLRLMGALVIALAETRGHRARFLEEEVDRFDVTQDQSSGALTVSNLTFEVGGRRCILSRPLNTRERWSLWLVDEGDPDLEEIRVFDDVGALSPEMLAFIGADERS